MALLCVEDLDHLVLNVADIKVTCRFYQRVLGMTPFMFGNGRTALSFGSRRINLYEVGQPYSPQPDKPLPGTAELCFLSRTPVVELLDHLKAENVAVEEGPVRREGALGPITSVYFRDPDGNMIEVANYTEA
ncbi:MAG: VOC family protein [Bilophila sp.]